MESGSSIRTDAGGSVSFDAPTNILIGGSVITPSGEISVSLSGVEASDLYTGYDPTQNITIASGAVLDASGVFVRDPSLTGIITGQVFDGGSVNVTAERGFIDIQDGALVDVSGASAQLDLLSNDPNADRTTYERRLIGSAGGSIDIVSPEGARLNGSLRGAAGATDTAFQPEGGSLRVATSTNSLVSGFSLPEDPNPAFPTNESRILVVDGTDPGVTERTTVFDVAIADEGGFSNLELLSDDVIEFAQDVTLAVQNRLKLSTRNLRAGGASEVNVDANFIAVGQEFVSANPATASAGGAVLNLNANNIELVGDSATQGFGEVNLNSQNDVLARGVFNQADQEYNGSFSVANNLNINAAQLYPASFSRFEIAALGGKIRVDSSGTEAPAIPLSALGDLTLRANEIEQAGRIIAPLGRIALEAAESLTLEDGSITSVSGGDQTQLLGSVSGGVSWIYSTNLLEIQDDRLEKRIVLDGPDVKLEDGSLVDLSGGGDLLGYEWVSGPGGSIDALLASENPNLFAIIPGRGIGGITFDADTYNGSGSAAGRYDHAPAGCRRVAGCR